MKFLNIICVLLVALMVLGCGSSSGEKQTNYNFKQGIANLEIEELDNAPPDKVYPNSNFKIVLELANQVAYDITNGKIQLTGLDEKFFVVSPKEQYFTLLEGRSLTNPPGDRIYVEFSGSSKELFLNSEQYRNPFFVNLYFDSTLQFTDTVCVNPNVYDVYDGGCEVREKLSYSGQGAPISVDKIEQAMFPSGNNVEIEYRVFVENKGGGVAEHFELKKASLGGKDLSCEFKDSSLEGKQRINLEKMEQEAILVCKTSLENQGSYTTTLLLDFEYSYKQKEDYWLTLVK